MFENDVVKLIIVCDEKTREFANHLSQLIGQKDDNDNKIIGVKDESVEAVVWLEKDYIANSPTLSSKARVIFIGKNNVSKKETGNMKIQFNKYGMNYGWLGKRAMMYVDKKLLNKEEYDEFAILSKKHQDKFSEVAIPRFLSVMSALGKKQSLLLTGPVLAGPVLILEGIYNKISIEKICKQQYLTLTLIFYLEGLNEFLKG